LLSYSFKSLRLLKFATKPPILRWNEGKLYSQ